MWALVNLAPLALVQRGQQLGRRGNRSISVEPPFPSQSSRLPLSPSFLQIAPRRPLRLLSIHLAIHLSPTPGTHMAATRSRPAAASGDHHRFLRPGALARLRDARLRRGSRSSRLPPPSSPAPASPASPPPAAAGVAVLRWS